MTITVTTTPTNPTVEDDEITLVPSSTLGASVFVFELLSIPPTSEATKGLLLEPSSDPPTSPFDAVNRDKDDNRTGLSVVPLRSYVLPADVAGEYGIRTYGFRVPAGLGTHKFDPLRDRTPQLIETADTTIHVGAVVRLPLVTLSGHGATLALTIVNETIRVAALEDATTELARVAALDAGVVAALAVMVGQAPLAVMGDFATRVEDLRIQLEAGEHFATGGGGGWHTVADTANVIQRMQITSPVGAVAVLNACLRSLEGHLRPGRSSTRWHTSDDEVNFALVGPASKVGEAQVLLSDLRERVYERHRVLGTAADPDVHINAGGDTTNALTAPTLFDALVIAYFDLLAATSISAVTGESEGVADARAAGFE